MAAAAAPSCPRRPAPRTLADALAAAALAGLVSGLPSTAWALAQGGDPLEATRAAGTLLGRPSVARAAVAHGAISVFWAVVLARLLPRRATVLAGLAAGAGIAAVDLGLVGRRFPAIAALRVGPQVADHLVFGATVGLVLRRRQAAALSWPG